MFGYVLPVKCEMRVKDFERYRGVYCGVCKELGRQHGQLSRFLLNYDLVLLAVLADGLSGEAGEQRRESCAANPIEKRMMLHETAGLRLGADGVVMLSYHKLKDNLLDEKGPKKAGYRLASWPLGSVYRRAARRNPELDRLLGAQMARQQTLEAAGSASVDEACEPTALMCAALFEAAAATPEQKPILKRLGLFCGQIVYLLDAAEDYTDDAAKGRYNVFIKAGLPREEAVARAQTRCRMAAGEIALCYNLLELKQHKEILDNIFFLGLSAGIAAAGEKRTGNIIRHSGAKGDR